VNEKKEKKDFAKIFFLYLLRRTKIEYYAFCVRRNQWFFVLQAPDEVSSCVWALFNNGPYILEYYYYYYYY
tara:strand:+ start:86 stop:298 length:213 start_codon:yes stop_codon:yes gene_type:complete